MIQTARDQAVAIIRKARGDTSQQKFGVNANLTGETINRIERGVTIPTLNTLDRIAASIGCEVLITFEPLKGRKT